MTADLAAIRQRWQGRVWRYEDYQGKAALVTETPWRLALGRAGPETVAFLQLAAQAPADVQALLARIAELEEALGHYTGAEIVTNWVMQETGDDGQVARQALGLPSYSRDVVQHALDLLASDAEPESLMLYVSWITDGPTPAIERALHRWRFEPDDLTAIVADLKAELEAELAAVTTELA